MNSAMSGPWAVLPTPALMAQPAEISAEDGLDKLVVDLAQVAGAVLSLVAIVIAVLAMAKSNRDLAKERRRQHELEVLRDIAEILARLDRETAHTAGDLMAPFDEVQHLKTRLILIKSNDDFPMTRAAIGAHPAERGAEAFAARFRTAVERKEKEFQQEEARGGIAEWRNIAFELAAFRLGLVVTPQEGGHGSILARELDDAIEKRMKSR
ncbi:hypothetical protein ACTI_60750 [Actinoplanes sp. OR16]|uniref:hypothetical protein n=1 Tax=Actinoplanes sp. OR16 TaxID=946334 RepID=UPI000F6D4B42|nr:hypothetical protein [Actinoplanes sp. OR16]BBH69390.1 hypothetical protein ACTI_60750 [Actinoplanes sp. OR16]